MTEYIERSYIRKMAMLEMAYTMETETDAAVVLRMIDDAPAADVAPVVHGRWAHLGGDEWCCSACGFVITTEGSWDKPTKKYCEDCGAKMDGERKDGKDG